jgi:CheY-like chemotaxis protein
MSSRFKILLVDDNRALIEALLADGNIAVLPKPVDIAAILDRLDKTGTRLPLVIIDNDPDPTLLHQLSEKGYELAATTRPTAALMLTERWRLVLLSRTIPHLRQSDWLCSIRATQSALRF